MNGTGTSIPREQLDAKSTKSTLINDSTTKPAKVHMPHRQRKDGINTESRVELTPHLATGLNARRSPAATFASSATTPPPTIPQDQGAVNANTQMPEEQRHIANTSSKTTVQLASKHLEAELKTTLARIESQEEEIAMLHSVIRNLHARTNKEKATLASLPRMNRGQKRTAEKLKKVHATTQTADQPSNKDLEEENKTMKAKIKAQEQEIASSQAVIQYLNSMILKDKARLAALQKNLKNFAANELDKNRRSDEQIANNIVKNLLRPGATESERIMASAISAVTLKAARKQLRKTDFHPANL